MARLAVLAGRTISDFFRNILVVVIITGVGFLVGFRPGGTFVSYVQACILMLFFAYCLSWGSPSSVSRRRTLKAAQAMTFPLIFPLTFASCNLRPRVEDAELAARFRHPPAGESNGRRGGAV